MRVAVIGIGSNSVRLLVADCVAGAYHTVLRGRCGTRLFAGLEQGRLSEASMQATCDAVCAMADQARELGVKRLHAFATSATRDAVNQQAFCDLLNERAGISLDICSGEEEALLSYWGAERPGLCGMIDIGGGSTEWTIGHDGISLAAVSLQMGCVRLHRQLPIAREEDLPNAIAAAQTALQPGLARLAGIPRPAVWVGVGGTATTLAAMDKSLTSFDRSLVEGHELQLERVLHWGNTLAGLSPAQRAELPGLQPQRADIVVHGIAILLACMRLLEAPSIIVSDHGNLDGYLRKRVLQACADDPIAPPTKRIVNE